MGELVEIHICMEHVLSMVDDTSNVGFQEISWVDDLYTKLNICMLFCYFVTHETKEIRPNKHKFTLHYCSIEHVSLVMRKPYFGIYAKTKVQISCAVTAQLISALGFATQIVQSLYLLNPKFQASSHLLWLHSPVYVGPGRKPQTDFPQRGSYVIRLHCSDMGVIFFYMSLSRASL